MIYKRFYIFCLYILTGCMFLFGQTAKDIRKYRSYIKEFDIYQEELQNMECNASLFWNTVAELNPNLNAFYDGISKKKLKKITEEYENIDKMFSSMRLPDIATDKETQQWIEEYIAGKSLYRPIKRICISYDGEYNAFSSPDGYLVVSDRLFFDCENSELIGILAHEMAHFVLQHYIVHEDYKKKQKRKNTVLSALGTLATSMAAAGIQSGGGMTQEQADEMWENVREGNDALIDAFRIRTLLSNYRYSREQEIEADILAYRFMEFVGRDPNDYIRVLEKLKKNNISYISEEDEKFSSHPLIVHRINILRMLE